MPIYDNVVLVCEGVEFDEEDFVVFFTCTSLKHPVLLYDKVFLLGEVVEPTIPLEIVTHLLEVPGTYIQNGFILHEDIYEILAGLYQMCMEEFGIQSYKE